MRELSNRKDPRSGTNHGPDLALAHHMFAHTKSQIIRHDLFVPQKCRNQSNKIDIQVPL